MIASGTPVQSVKEHKKITDEIDDMYMDTLFAEANLQTFLVSPHGANRSEQVLSFYRSFRGLFTHTRHMKGMDEITEEDKKKKIKPLIEQVEDWFLDGTDPRIRKGRYPDNFLKRGLSLFSKYQKKLIAKGVVSVIR
jgi:hypothetical protein